ncbi:MAG: UDP-N-acetylmuramoyl-L-alanyl-D-glutamate--2,6-diaminopimelate ligase [Patescibacteria group bacterium]
MFKRIIKKLVPKKLLYFYHWSLARLAALYYFFPSNKLIVIGVTGTNGKTTTVSFIAQYLEALGQKVGSVSTASFKVGSNERLNNKKMTMLGRFQTQKFLREAVKNGCRYAVIETSSQGIDQYRHIGINYDVVVFTNLTPEHIEAHGGWENYKAAKEKLFAHLSGSRNKKIGGRLIDKAIVSNGDDQETEILKKFPVDRFFTYSLDKPADLMAERIDLSTGHLSFFVDGQKIKTNFLGRFNVYNILASLGVVKILGFDLARVADAQLRGVPGRQEWITAGQDFNVLIDYAPEPASLEQLYSALKDVKHKRLIHVIGSCGGGRDKARQPILGKMAGQTADLVVVTNEDPYDDDPEAIIANVAQGSIEAGKVLGANLFKISDRRAAIKKALTLAKKDDLVLITGKGAEQFICVANSKKLPWDDRVVVREELNKLL